MNDLMTAYEEARFGKAAADDNRSVTSRIADYFAMSKLTPENRELRDTVEESIRDEKRLRAQAKSEIASARGRLKQPADTSGMSWLLDLARSAIPGLAPTAAPKDDGIEKEALELDEEGPSSAGMLAHTLAGVGGALGGAGVQQGRFGGIRGARDMAQHYPRSMGDAAKSIAADVRTNAVGRKSLERTLKRLNPEELALIAQGKPGLLKRIMESISDFTAFKIKPREAAQTKLKGMLGTRGPLAGDLAKSIERTQSGYARTSRKVLPPKGWKLGAGLGAVATTLPFILYNLIRARRARSQGGPGTGAARSRAAQMLEAADKTRGEREQLLTKLPK